MLLQLFDRHKFKTLCCCRLCSADGGGSLGGGLATSAIGVRRLRSRLAPRVGRSDSAASLDGELPQQHHHQPKTKVLSNSLDLLKEQVLYYNVWRNVVRLLFEMIILSKNPNHQVETKILSLKLRN